MMDRDMAAGTAGAAPCPRLTMEDGGELHLVPVSPEALPRVDKRDLEQAWEAARNAARAGREGIARGFRFANGEDFALDDRDARAWAMAVDDIADLSTAHGVSVCVRLLALIDVIGRARWLAPFVSLGGAAACFDASLLQAAALARLTPEARLDEAELRKLMPGRARREEIMRCSA